MSRDIVNVTDSKSFNSVFPVSRETIERLVAYEELLRKWQRSINLVSAATLDDVWQRHIWDSAQLLFHAPPEARNWIDLGSGAGFPGLVVAILLIDRPGFAMQLVESDKRKSIFLREVARVTGANVTVHDRRIEDFKASPDRMPDVISARALAPLHQILTLSAPIWAKNTIGLFLKGRNVTDELTESSKDWIFNYETIASQSDPSGTVLKLWELNHADLRRDR